MKRTVFIYCYERQIYICSLCAGKFFLSFLRSLFKSLKSHFIISQIHTVFFSETVSHKIQQSFIKIIATQLIVAVCRQNLENSVTQFQNRYIKCSAAQVINQNLMLCLILIKTISQ